MTTTPKQTAVQAAIKAELDARRRELEFHMKLMGEHRSAVAKNAKRVDEISATIEELEAFLGVEPVAPTANQADSKTKGEEAHQLVEALMASMPDELRGKVEVRVLRVDLGEVSELGKEDAQALKDLVKKAKALDDTCAHLAAAQLLRKALGDLLECITSTRELTVAEVTAAQQALKATRGMA